MLQPGVPGCRSGTALLPTMLTVLAISTALAVPVARAQSNPQEGREYSTLEVPACLAPASSEVEIVEIFSYTCIHCYRLEDDLQNWKQHLPEGVRLHKMPVIWGSGDERLGRLFWAIQIAGVSDAQVQKKIFSQIHDRRLPFSSDADIRVILGRLGLGDTGEAKIARISRSFLVNTRIKRSRALTRNWKITGTPAFVVAGRYLIAATRQNGLTRRGMMDVALWLAKRELQNGGNRCRQANTPA